MSCRDNKLKYNCGTRTNARCVFYEGYLPEHSKLKDEDCVTIEETTDELYHTQEDILDSIDLSSLGKLCLEYDNSTDKLKVKEVLLAIEKEICKLKSASEENDNGSLNLDFKCLTSPCGEQITTLNELLQVLIDEICALKGQ